MNRRINGILIALLVGLGVVAWFTLNKPGEQSAEQGSAEALFAVDTAAIDGIDILHDGAVLTLNRSENGWKLTTPVSDEADIQTVNDLLSSVASATIRAVASTNPAKQSLFQTDTLYGTIVTLRGSGAVLSSAIIGKQGAEWNERYVRRSNSDEVLLVAGLQYYRFTKPVKEWRSKTILALDSRAISSVTVTANKESFTLALRDSVWTIDGKPADSIAVQNFITALASVTADDFRDTPPLSSAKNAVSLKYAGNELLFAPEGNKYTVFSAASSRWYIMDEWRAKQYLKNRSDFFKR